MSATNSPIFIIVSALMTVVGIGIVVSITMNFGEDTQAHSDTNEFNNLAQSIEQECERLEDQGQITFTASADLALRENGILLEEDTLKYDNQENDPERTLDCNVDIENSIDFEGEDEGLIPTGNHRILIDESGDGIEVSNS